jgi:hypothetical protein
MKIVSSNILAALQLMQMTILLLLIVIIIAFKYSAKMETGSKQLENKDLKMVNSMYHGMLLSAKHMAEYL